METWVVNLDEHSGRWERMRSMLRTEPPPLRFSAVPDDHRVKLPWLGLPYPDVPRRQAIVRTYHQLARYLQTRPADTFLILQDDIEIVGPGAYDGSPLHILGGWHPKRPNAKTDPVHICPRGFIARQLVLPELEAAWSDMSRQICETWIPVVKRHATFESEQVVIEGGVPVG